VVIFENKAADEVAGSGRAPTFDALGAQGMRFTRSYGIAHPSQPNYLALFAGATFGITDDSCPHTFTAPNLAAQLAAAGLTFTGYAEGLPDPGYAGCRTGRYARKHAPWTNFAGLPESASQPFTAFPADFAALPSVAFVVPDLCDDMHDCPVATGDAWLAAHLGAYAAWARTHRSLLVVTFDEADGDGPNRIPTIVVGDGVPVGHDDTVVDQYSMLRTLEACFGLPGIGVAAGRTPLSGVCR
jgi:phosphatidylinositol-3-phosphatase